MREVRYLNADDYPAYGQVAGYSYNLAPQRITGVELTRAERFGDRSLGILCDGQLAAAMLDRRFVVNINGAAVPANGIGMLASSPETRRRGLVRDMLQWHLGQLHQEGVVLSLLYPFQFPFYRRLGWGFASRLIQLNIPPKEFAWFGRDVGRIKRLLAADQDGIRPEPGLTKEQVIDILQRVYEGQSGGLNLSARRSPNDWERLFLVEDGQRYVYGWQSAAGEIEGYFIGSARGTEYPGSLNTREMFSASPQAWRGLCWYLSCHDSHIKSVRMTVPTDHPLLELLGDPRQDAKLVHGPMARAADVAGLLRTRGTGAANTGRCVIRVTDELAGWNNGDFAVNCDGGGVVHAAKLPDHQAVVPDVCVTIDVFSPMAVGTRSLADFIKLDLAQVKAGPGLEFALRLFPTRPVWHLEYY